MNFNTKSYNTETVKELQEMQRGINETTIVNGGFPVFNTCEHTTIDMTTIPNNDMHTLSIKVGHDQYVTLCVMPMMNGDYTNIDVKMYSPDEFKNHAIHFSKRGVGAEDTRISDFNLMALICEKKK